MPHALMKDKLGSYGAARQEITPGLEQPLAQRLEQPGETSHRHTRRREKIMGHFKSARQAQRFLSAHIRLLLFSL
ncbi:hypothetical protein PsAD13_01964 [Pseudovibrio sp. Ad13]|nr:hypothetical protein PsAD13_01964 [Pseudovibrio sp. Ad13]